MSTNLSDPQAFAAPVPLRLNGVEYILSPLTLADLAELTRWKRAQIMRDALVNLPADASKELREAITREANEQGVAFAIMSQAGMQAVFQDPDATIRAFWLSVRKRQPTITPEAAGELIGPHNMADVMQAFATANGLKEEQPADPPLAATAPAA
jgi:hypothetical protein